MSLQVLKLDDLKRQKHKLLSKLASRLKLWQGFFFQMTLRHYIWWKWTWNPQRMVKACRLNTFVRCKFNLILKYPHYQAWCHCLEKTFDKRRRVQGSSSQHVYGLLCLCSVYVGVSHLIIKTTNHRDTFAFSYVPWCQRSLITISEEWVIKSGWKLKK